MSPTLLSHALAPAGYTQPWVVQPGAPVALHASLPHATVIDIVRIGCANAERQPDGAVYGPAERILSVEGTAAQTLGPAPQPLVPGAQVNAACASLPSWTEASLVLALHRTARGTPGHVLSLRGAQGTGLVLELQAQPRKQAVLNIQLQPSGKALQLPLPSGEWTLLVLDLLPVPGQAAECTLRARTALCRATVPDGIAPGWIEHSLSSQPLPPGAPSHLHLGTRSAQQVSADVRLDLVSVLPRARVEGVSPRDLLACDPGGAESLSLSPWEQAALRDPESACLLRARSGTGHSTQDLARNASLTEPQRPYTAVRGVRWDGRFQGPDQAPAHYTALHFNADTLLDAHWSPTQTWVVPPELDSGCYAFRMRPVDQPDAEPSYASFFVSAATRPRHALAVLLPTFSYLAYANATEEMRGPVVTPSVHMAEQRLDAVHPAHGRSLYERHADGQTVLWASSRRPLWSVSPGHRPWQFVADTWLLDWLETQEQDFDIITDQDLHRLGAAALEPYRVVLTGHHPEYPTTAMWDGLWRYLQSGGRLMYLGGNGFYWRTACDEAAEAIEVRRAEDGTRPSIGAPGEYYCAFTGEYGGIWRRLGRPPQQIVGVGMAAQGFEHSAYYRKCADAKTPEMAFVFHGVHDDTFGHAGWWGKGASGWEIDRIDMDLGTPPQTWWLGRSEGHAPSMMRTKEELLSYVPPFHDAKARSDVALAPVGRGHVFSVGSMTWIGSLHGEGGVPTDIATVTSNVIRRFLDPTPLPQKTEPE